MQGLRSTPPPSPPHTTIITTTSSLLRFRLSCNSSCGWEGKWRGRPNDRIQFVVGGRGSRCPHRHCVGLWMGGGRSGRNMAVQVKGCGVRGQVAAACVCTAALKWGSTNKATGAESVKSRIANTRPAGRLFCVYWKRTICGKYIRWHRTAVKIFECELKHFFLKNVVVPNVCGNQKLNLFEVCLLYLLYTLYFSRDMGTALLCCYPSSN